MDEKTTSEPENAEAYQHDPRDYPDGFDPSLYDL
jgi:hypothetical protein